MGGASAHQVVAQGDELAGEIGNASLIVDAEQCLHRRSVLVTLEKATAVVCSFT